MEFDQYGRLRNPGISSTEPVNNYTHIRNERSIRTFFLWDWFNDLIINIGNFIATSTEFIIGALAWIAIIGGAIIGIALLYQIWTENGLIAAIIITVICGGIVYYIFMIILGIMYWIVAISLAILRFIFYNAYTFLLFIGICGGIVWYINRHPSDSIRQKPTTNTLVTQPISRYRCTARTLNVRRQPYKGAPIIGKLHKGDIVEVYDTSDGFAHIKYGYTKAWASLDYLEKMQ